MRENEQFMKIAAQEAMDGVKKVMGVPLEQL